MASVTNSEYRQAQRTDGGPFLALLPLDDIGLPAKPGETIAGVDVFYSDVPVPDGTAIGADPWLHIMNVTTEMLTIWPIQQRFGHRDYGKRLFDSIQRIMLYKPIDDEYELPTDNGMLEDMLEGLPAGFYKDWRYGLGLRWEFRSIITTIQEMPDIDTIIFHAPADQPGTDFTRPPFYLLGMHTFHALRKQLTSISERHQRAARKEKRTICHNTLLHSVAPESFQKEHLSLQPDTLAEMTSTASGGIKLTKRDQRAAVKLVQQHTTSLAKEEPAELLRLKENIELVSLRELIDRCTQLLDVSTTEPKWQSFLSDNPFILTMAFHYPVVKIGDTPYVGGKSFRGSGGSHSDFLMAAAATNNLALVEIKRPGTQLVGTVYRGIYPPSHDLSGAVAQVVAQRSELQQNFRFVGAELDRKGFRPHSIACVVVAGLKPTDEEQAQGFEQYRHTLQGVHVVTFDELVDRLKALLDLLAGSQPALPTEPIGLPF